MTLVAGTRGVVDQVDRSASDPEAPHFGLSPQLERLRREVRGFVDAALPRAGEAGVPWDLVEALSDRGWRTLAVPREHGGSGADALALCVLLEELARGDTGLAVLVDQTLKVARAVAALAPARTRSRVLDELVADPRGVLALAVTEPETSSDYFMPNEHAKFRTRAERRPEGGWLLDGRKHFISNGGEASRLLVAATTDPERPLLAGTSVLLVDRDQPGVRVERLHAKAAQRSTSNAVLAFEGVVVPHDRLLGEPHTGYAASRRVMAASPAEAGAIALGTAQAAYELAVDHAGGRVQGGARDPRTRHRGRASRPDVDRARNRPEPRLARCLERRP
jgi:alkylation response protein AidB-like acyl-CoA dehydrogenase